MQEHPCSASEAGSYLRRIDSCITRLKAQVPSETYDESKEEEAEEFLNRAGFTSAAVIEFYRGMSKKKRSVSEDKNPALKVVRAPCRESQGRQVCQEHRGSTDDHTAQDSYQPLPSEKELTSKGFRTTT